MKRKEHESLLVVKKSKFLFSITFTFVLPICTVFSPLPLLIFNILYFPFTLAHEVGHFVVIKLVLPSLDPHLKFYISNGEFCCACLTTNEFPHCWQSIIAMFAGSTSVITLAILGSLFWMKSGSLNDTGKYYLTFGVLADLPNLLPILPSTLRFVNDGFAINSYLCQMGYSFSLSNKISYLFSVISILMVLTSFFFLGMFLYRLGEHLVTKFEKGEMNESI
ncbi:MAG: hypothetical protein JSW11_17925 [Candidatus Heimdallarchaeota archaeon]|nr:MAG: hypothetical protein JSW11_17925 [Candidatus Heimdallarchaeota archaeon]